MIAWFKVLTLTAAQMRSWTKCIDGKDCPSIIDERSDFLNDVLMRVCKERDLTIALKLVHKPSRHE